MSYSISLIGRDKEKLKEAVRAQQCKDETNSPHSGVPAHVADLICTEIDRFRVYQQEGKTFGIKIEGNGSFHDSGRSETLSMGVVQLVE